MSREFSLKYSEGHDVEGGVLGEVKPESRVSMEEYREKKERGELRDITIEQAIDIVKAHQPFNDPTNPSEKRFPLDVHAMVAKSLGLENYEQLKYYTAVDSLLDKWGIDAFFELSLENGILRISLDITIDENKLATKKADVPFLWPRDGLNLKDPEDKVIFNRIVQEVSGDVVRSFNIEAEKQGLVISSLSLEDIQGLENLAKQKRQRHSLRSFANTYQ